MSRTLITMLGALGGFLEGMMLFVMANATWNSPFDVFASGAWLDYPVLIFGSVGMICGAVLGWAAHGWANNDRLYHSVPRKPPVAGAPPYKGPFG